MYSHPQTNDAQQMCLRVAFATRVVVVASDIAICRLNECTICRASEQAPRFKYRRKPEIAISEAIERPRGVVVPEGRGPNSRAAWYRTTQQRHEVDKQTISDLP